MGRNFEKRVKSPSYIITHLQFFKITHCNLNGTKAAVEGLMLFSLWVSSGSCYYKGALEPSVRSDQTLRP